MMPSSATILAVIVAVAAAAAGAFFLRNGRRTAPAPSDAAKTDKTAP